MILRLQLRCSNSWSSIAVPEGAVAVAKVCVAARITAAEVNARQTNNKRGERIGLTSAVLHFEVAYDVLRYLACRWVDRTKDINSERLE